MNADPGHVILDDYICTDCDHSIELVDGIWECECYGVHAIDLDYGMDDIPDFWIPEDG